VSGEFDGEVTRRAGNRHRRGGCRLSHAGPKRPGHNPLCLTVDSDQPHRVTVRRILDRRWPQQQSASVGLKLHVRTRLRRAPAVLRSIGGPGPIEHAGLGELPCLGDQVGRQS
jgi:hypothetical protein